MTAAATSVQYVQSLFDAFNRGDLDFILARVAPDCRWVAPGQGIPNAGVYTGPSGAAEFFRIMGETEEIVRFEVNEYFTNGDDVVALIHEEIRSRKTGKPAETNGAMVFRIRDGKVYYWESFYDTSAYARAHQG
jgi:ketosteroid isomerase-like protein